MSNHSDPSTPPRARRGLPDLGRRGGGWVALQAVLFMLSAAAGWFGPRWATAARPWLLTAAGLAYLVGIGLLLAGGAGIGRQLTPFPRPTADGTLRQDGVFRLVRHPIYGGVLLILLAWALTSSPLALAGVALGIVFFEAKRRREEAWLLARYPEYDGYRRRVRKVFVPFVW